MQLKGVWTKWLQLLVNYIIQNLKNVKQLPLPENLGASEWNFFRPTHLYLYLMVMTKWSLPIKVKRAQIIQTIVKHLQTQAHFNTTQIQTLLQGLIDLEVNGGTIYWISNFLSDHHHLWMFLSQMRFCWTLGHLQALSFCPLFQCIQISLIWIRLLCV